MTLQEWLSTVVDKTNVDEIMARITAEKLQMDTETRRKVRAVWAWISIAAFFLGVLAGHFLW